MDIFHERELGENGDVLFELPLVNDHSNGLFVDARNETNIDSKSSFG